MAHRTNCFYALFSSSPKPKVEKKPKKEDTYLVIHPYADIRPPVEPPPAGIPHYNNNYSTQNAENNQKSTLYSLHDRGQLKCKRCQIFYDPKVEEIDRENENETCKFHSGRFENINNNIIKRWTCCGETSYDFPPCSTGKHIECKTTSQNIRKYQQLEAKYAGMVPKSQLHSKENQRVPSSIQKKSEKEEEEDVLVDLEDVEVKDIDDPLFFLSGPCLPKREEFSDSMAKRAADSIKPQRTIEKMGEKEFLKHVVKSTDTLVGLSVKYDVKTDDIKYFNRLVKDSDLFTKPVVLIPYKGQKITHPNKRTELDERKQEMKRMVKRFHKQTGCELEAEAKFYLDDSNFDYELALQKFREDSTWDSKQSK
eukprot:TRINITY_DN2659_c0_g1_i1.p1 TRINITY_DN2659_c0_g1~~TRINITY_DN2659_c0_g1_i1.p1  ORF type:complete len:367 (+),score=143.14 TRINITY_DN2659_c0_g1_i1:102-1202(+)